MEYVNWFFGWSAKQGGAVKLEKAAELAGGALKQLPPIENLPSAELGLLGVALCVGLAIYKEVEKIDQEIEVLEQNLQKRDEKLKEMDAILENMKKESEFYDNPPRCLSNPCMGCKSPGCPQNSANIGKENNKKSEQNRQPATGGASEGGDEYPNNTPTCEEEMQQLSTETLQKILTFLLGVIQACHDNGVTVGVAEQYALLRGVYYVVKELISRGYVFERTSGLRDLVLQSPDGRWSQVFYSNLGSFFDLSAFSVSSTLRSTTCPRMIHVEFGETGLNLTVEPCVNRQSGFYVYGLSCKPCIANSRSSTSLEDIIYVGLTTQSIHLRVCQQHANQVRSEKQRVTLGKHLERSHIRDDIWKSYTHGILKFRDLFDVFDLPTGPNNSYKKRRSWELFWQWVTRSLEDFGGASKK